MRNGKGGTYVESYSLARNFELEEDIMETMTSNILKLVEKPIFQMLEEVDNLEGVLIRVTVKVQVDDSDINRWLNKSNRKNLRSCRKWRLFVMLTKNKLAKSQN